MTISLTRFALAVRRLAAVVVLCLLPLAAMAASATTQASSKLEDARGDVEKVEAALGRDTLRDRDLEQLKLKLDPLREALQTAINTTEPRFAEINARLKELGKKPEADAPPEDGSITAEREELEKAISALDADLKQARVLLLRIDQVGERITERRRALFAAEVFSRSSGIFNPGFWTRAIAVAPDEMRGVAYLGADWLTWVEARGGQSALVQPALVLAAMTVIGLIVARWWGRKRTSRDLAFDAPRLAHALSAWRVFLAGAVPSIAVGAVLLWVLQSHDLLPPRLVDLGQSILVAVVVMALARSTSRAVMAPDRQARRLLNFDSVRAGHLHRLMVWGSRVFAATVVLNALHKAVVAPLALTLATSAVMVLIMLALVAWTLLATKPEAPEDDAEAVKPDQAPASEPEDDDSRAQRWLRLFGWIVILVCLVSLSLGYVGFAAFFIGRLVIAAILIGIIYLAIALIDAVVQEAMSASASRGRRVASMLGVSPSTLDVTGTVLSGITKVVLVAFAAVVALGPWGVHVVDVTSTFSEAFFSLQIDSLIGPVMAVAGAVVLLVGMLIVTRLLQGWLERNLLPRTRIEHSLQHSVKQIIGYLGIIVAVLLALGQLGIDLQNIALVAGALSVGIGFGLQSIVSNFVSGLILLTERPIRVGDTIAVKGEEGYVRRISVRSTEIETFERSSVIIPNTDLITGVVKNWTHGNPTGRVIVAVNIPYDADPDEVRDLLIAAACEHPQVLKNPTPRVFLVKFGDNALQFDLRCVVTNVDYSLTVRSDLHFSILYRLRKAGITMPVIPPLPEPVPRTPPAISTGDATL
ncbi:MAG: mechanosensitive ion channel family protein [Methylacidiphilales bacterium]|nr:mechanosensitive ion channel family protein [Candidatus Methylacidiphilales bacterium]